MGAAINVTEIWCFCIQRTSNSADGVEGRMRLLNTRAARGRAFGGRGSTGPLGADPRRTST